MFLALRKKKKKNTDQVQERITRWCREAHPSLGNPPAAIAACSMNGAAAERLLLDQTDQLAD